MINRTFSYIIIVLSIIIISGGQVICQKPNDNLEKKYAPIIKKIYEAATKDSSAWQKLAYMCDTFGPRLSGSENLEKALKWAFEEMKKEGLQNPRMDSVMVPHWVRGNEYCELVSPRKTKLFMLGLGGSIGTPSEGITAPVIVVSDFDELKKLGGKVIGKIVLFNEVYQNYGQAVQYRVWGTVHAAQQGAVASLIRSVSPAAIKQAHTGVMLYADTVPKIPHAAISFEDAAMIERLYKTGHNPVVHLYMEAKTLPDTQSYNVMSEIKGSEKPDEIIAIGGHSDSWDVGQGAQDDGGACIATWEAIKLLKRIGLKPKNTIRTVMWVNEENGTRGGNAYFEQHHKEKHKLMFEFDSGIFPPATIGYNGPDSLYNKLDAVEPLLQAIDSIKIIRGSWGVDIGPMVKSGIPGMNLNTRDNGKYFWWHHSEGDTPDKVDPMDLNKCIAAIASIIYIYSDLIE